MLTGNNPNELYFFFVRDMVPIYPEEYFTFYKKIETVYKPSNFDVFMHCGTEV